MLSTLYNFCFIHLKKPLIVTFTKNYRQNYIWRNYWIDFKVSAVNTWNELNVNNNKILNIHVKWNMTCKIDIQMIFFYKKWKRKQKQKKTLIWLITEPFNLILIFYKHCPHENWLIYCDFFIRFWNTFLNNNFIINFFFNYINFDTHKKLVLIFRKFQLF